MKKILAALLCAMMVFVVNGCGNNNTTSKNGNNEELTKEEITENLFELNNWMTSEYWNDSLCDIQWYITNGTSSTGGEINPEITLKRYNKAYKKAIDYNKFINSLDKNYSEVKESWHTMYEEMKKIDDYIQKNGVTANADPHFSLDLYTQSNDYFNECVDELEK